MLPFHDDTMTKIFSTIMDGYFQARVRNQKVYAEIRPITKAQNNQTSAIYTSKIFKSKTFNLLILLNPEIFIFEISEAP